MRIAVNTRFLLKDKLEGIGLYTHEVFKRIVTDHPDDEFIFCFDRPYDERFIYSENVIPLKVLPPARHPVLFYLWFEWALPIIFRNFRPDIFFSPDGFCSLHNSAPDTLIVIHDLSYFHYPDHLTKFMAGYYRKFMPRFIQKAEKIITVSNYSKRDVIQNFKVEESKIVVCQNGCREIFHPINEVQKLEMRNRYTAGDPFFLTLGAIQPRKNLVRLIESFNIFKKETGAQHKLVLAGRRAWKTAELNQAVSRSPFRKDIIFTGYVQDKELGLLMGSSFAFIYPSLWEGFGLPILEAMHCDVPIIASNTSALPETGGKAALSVDPLSIQSISDGLIKIWKDENLREVLIKEGRIQRKRFDWKSTAACVYNQIITTASR